MIQLLKGTQHFSNEVFKKNQKMFEGLAKGQSPHMLLITCSDSRIDPNLVTQAKPGEIFIVRNVGNIIPPYGASGRGEEAAIEFAIEALGVRNIIVCGHSHCGAMAALTSSDYQRGKQKAVAAWLDHAEATKRRVNSCEHIDAESMVAIVQENVLVQVDNLKTHPSVSVGLRQGKLSIFGWVYHFETGSIEVYDQSVSRFISVSEIADLCESRMKDLAL